MLVELQREGTDEPLWRTGTFTAAESLWEIEASPWDSAAPGGPTHVRSKLLQLRDLVPLPLAAAAPGAAGRPGRGRGQNQPRDVSTAQEG